MKKSFGIIGAGNIAKAVAAHLLKAGHVVTLSSRKDPSSLQDTIASLGANAKAGTLAEAAQADIIVLALPWKEIPTLTNLTDWNNKIVIDSTNHYATPDFQLAALGDKTSSEVVAEHLQGAHLVKAFNTLYYRVLEADPKESFGKRVLFISGNHAEEKQEVKTIIETFGFAVIDLGTLAAGGKLQDAKGPLSAINLIRKS